MNRIKWMTAIVCIAVFPSFAEPSPDDGSVTVNFRVVMVNEIAAKTLKPVNLSGDLNQTQIEPINAADLPAVTVYEKIVESGASPVAVELKALESQGLVEIVSEETYLVSYGQETDVQLSNNDMEFVLGKMNVDGTAEGEIQVILESYSGNLFGPFESQFNIQDGGTVIPRSKTIKFRSFKESRVPLLGDLPLIGSVFRRTQMDDDKGQALLFVTANQLE